MSNMLTAPGSRMTYEKSLELLANAGITEQNAVLSQSYIRSEMLISSSTTNYKMPILVTDNNNAQFNTERRLTLQDAFVLSELWIGLGVPSGTADATFEPLTYPDPTKFSTGGAAASAMTLYNGFLQASVNNFTIVPGWDISRHLVRNQTQAGVIITAQTVLPFNQIDFATDGFYPVQPNLISVGSKNIQWTIILPAAIATVQTNSRIIMIQRGLLAQNSTTVH